MILMRNQEGHKAAQTATPKTTHFGNSLPGRFWSWIIRQPRRESKSPDRNKYWCQLP